MNAGAPGTLGICTLTTRLTLTATTVKSVSLGYAQETHPRFAELQPTYWPIATLAREGWLQKPALSSSRRGRHAGDRTKKKNCRLEAE